MGNGAVRADHARGERTTGGTFRAAALLVSVAGFAAGGWLAWHHVVAPVAATAAFVGWCAAAARWPRLWLFALPALLPLLNFSPWTGWTIVEELDLLVLGAVGAAALRRALGVGARCPAAAGVSGSRLALVGAALVFGVASVASLVVGLHSAGGLEWPASLALGWFQRDADPLNSWRVFKSVAWAALLWLLLRREIRDDASGAVRKFAAGMTTGVAIVTLAALWERAAYPGFWNFTLPYRTTALFWEMRVGGAAIDAYLAMATPFVAWALWSARSAAHWVAAAGLALAVGYACLTTFSRGVYFGVAVPLVLLGVWTATQRVDGRLRSAVLHVLALGAALLGAAVTLVVAFEVGGLAGGGAALAGLVALALELRRRLGPMRRRSVAALMLALALLVEVVAVLGMGSFMRERIAAVDADAGSRLDHWRHGLGLMRSPSHWLWGIGTGRLPADYAARVAGGEFPGSVEYLSRDGRGQRQGAVRLAGPKTRSDLDGQLALTQRVVLHSGAGHRVAFDLRGVARADVSVSVCEMHLLYPRHCQRSFVQAIPSAEGWRHVSVPLHGRALNVGEPTWPRRAVFSIAVTNAGGVAEIDALELRAPGGEPLLVNGDFSQGPARWLPVARGHFVPWHIDNLLLELLIERGLPALLAFLLCVAIALWRLLGRAGQETPIAAFVAASICGAFSVGLLSSVMDVPRVALLLFVLLIVAIEITEPRATKPSAAGSDA